MVHVFRSCAGRMSVGAWRSRKFLVWMVIATCLMFVVYESINQDSISDPQNGGQQHRSLNSFRQQQLLQHQENAQKNRERVRFIENDYIKNVEREEVNNKDDGSLEARQDFDNERGNDSPEVIQRFNEPVEQIQRYGEGEIHNGNSKVNDIYGGNAAAAWSGGFYQYNPYGEPVYNHGNRPNYIPKERVIHFDLKGAPPIMSTYKVLIPWLAKNGATSILMEYEDMFPFTGVLSSFAAKNHYTKENIKEILQLCKANNIQVIPLVQTFGHLEFALKHPKYSYLREVPEMPQALCPSKNDSMWLVRNLVDQIMTLHPGSKYLHIGCDEVFQMGECDKCRMKSRENLFLDHVSKIAKYVRATHNAIPIIWHDMLNRVSETALMEYNFGELVEPMVWVYAEDVYRFVQPAIWTKFSRVFPTAWTASAFKGAFGEQSTVPNVRRHLDNNLNWLDVMSSENSKFTNGLRGIVLTGWQRHDHFAVMCELIPSALPSLAINLIATSHGFLNETLHPQLFDSLNCMQNNKYPSDLNLDTNPFMWDKFSWCYFPGSMIFKTTARLDAARRDVRGYIDRVTLKRGWISDYNRRHNFSSPMRVDEDMEELPSKIHTLTLLIKTAKEALLEWFDEWTTGEWIEQHIWPLLNELQTLQKESESMKLVKTWPVRPLPLLPQLKAYGINEPSEDKAPLAMPDSRQPPKEVPRQSPFLDEDDPGRIKYF